MGDSDGDGRADRREVYYHSFGFKDTHGMTDNFTWGFDGWVYACHGFSNTSEVRGADEKPITMQSGNTYRMRPDGSHIEYFTHGQVNPFGLAFDPLGNVYSCDCHSRPLYQLLRGAWYPSFGKPDDGLGFGPPMLNHDHGSTAISGLVYYAADGFPAPFRDNLFIGNVVTNRINRDRLEWSGSTPKAVELPDFLTSDDPWFRPVDLELGPDGAIYVADFYNRIIGHYEVPLTHPGRDRERGRIWRIVYRGPDAERPKGPAHVDLTKTAEQDLIQSLSHPNLAVRILAANQMVDRPDLKASAVLNVTLEEFLSTNSSPPRKVHALWILERRGRLDDSTLETAARDDSREVRVHAMRILGERAELDGPLHDLVLGGLKDGDAFVRRAAAEALGLHPDASHIRPLLDLRQSSPAEDTHLVHMTRMALRDQLRPATSWPRLADLSLSERDATSPTSPRVSPPPRRPRTCSDTSSTSRNPTPSSSAISVSSRAMPPRRMTCHSWRSSMTGGERPCRIVWHCSRRSCKETRSVGPTRVPSSPMPPTTSSESSSPRPGGKTSWRGSRWPDSSGCRTPSRRCSRRSSRARPPSQSGPRRC
ncbi:MAG: HEAT repeat domain-containing protein [Singulisphaera sp.]